ncbi:hypothetical protein IWW42_004378 [Coemansia sp. RSA 1085]|nr:hypothetical protein IWW42_004378 [Coemansia sp. RSA 1085]
MLGRSAVSRLTRSVRMFSTTRAGAMGAVRAGMVLQRNPIVIQQATGFEAAADQYFAWLDYVSADKFPREFFFKKGSSAEAKWMELNDERACDWYFDPQNKPQRKDKKKQQTEEDEDGEKRDEIKQTVEVQPRETAADAANDMRSLERRLDRTLYLVVKDKQGAWMFPQGDVKGEELLHEAARRSLKDMCGSRMRVWTVGKGPIGHCKNNDHTTFFVKSHILAGQVIPENKEALDYKWVTREEIQSVVASEYWEAVKDMLSTV